MTIEEIRTAIGGEVHVIETYETRHDAAVNLDYVPKSALDKALKALERCMQQRDDWRNGHFRDDDIESAKWETTENAQLMRRIEESK